jgi:hypothetical protein
MSEQTIQSHDIKVADVFQSFYSVPDYQREYVWGSEQVEQLLKDINGELDGADPELAPEYFIGSIVVCPALGGVFELIDGQQRMTTLFITLCAIRDHLLDIGQTPPGALEPQIAAISTDAAGQDHFRYRLDLQYEDSGEVLVKIAEGQMASLDSSKTQSIANIANAYNVVRGILTEEFGENDATLRAFYGYLTNKVKLIRIQTEDVAKALKIFETINDRGVGLNSMDLLKNLLFMKSSRDQFDRLKDIWKDLQDTIFEMGEKPLRFLRYFIFSRYDVDVLREDQIYNWFSKNEDLCGYADSPLEFANELVAAADAYQNFLSGRDCSGRPSRFLENMQILGGKAARQHLILLLAGRHLDSALFDSLAREVENLFFCYVITREQTRDFERNFAAWAVDLRRAETKEELDDLIERRFRMTKRELTQRFDDSMRRLYSDSVQQYRLRYILAKLTQHIELKAFGETEGTQWLKRFVSNGFEIEHIYPQNPSEDASSEFGPCEDDHIAERLGNLLLVEKSINASLGNQPYAVKKPVYRQSQLLLTRAQAERPQIGVNTKIDAAVSNLEPFQEWNEETIIQRQELLTKLAREVWDIPNS